MKGLLGRISAYRRTLIATHKKQKRPQYVSAKRIANCPLESGPEKKRKDEEISYMLSPGHKKVKKDKKRQSAALIKNCLPKVEADSNGGKTKEKVRKRKRTRPPAPLIKPAEGAEVSGEIWYKIKLEGSGAEVSYLRKTKGGGVLVELNLRITHKSTLGGSPSSFSKIRGERTNERAHQA